MILPQRRWEQVIQWFSDDEILAIHNAQLPERLAMQVGFKIDERRLSLELRAKHACDSLNAPVEGPEGRYCHWPRRLRETRVDGWGKA